MLRRKRRHYKHRMLPVTKLKKQTVHTVGAIWMWIIACIIMLSFFGEGSLLEVIRENLSLYVGWVMYMLPPYLVALSFLFFKVKSDLGKPYVPMGSSVILIGCIGLTQAGIFGEFLWNTVAVVISQEGAALLYLGFIVIGFIILFNTSLDQCIDFFILGFQTIGNIGVRIVQKLFLKKKTSFFEKKGGGLLIKGQTQEEALMKFPISPPPIPGHIQKKGVDSSSITIRSPRTTTPSQNVWEYPPTSLLSEGPGKKADRGDMRKNAAVIEKTLDGFGIQANVVEVNTGPAVTQYALEIALGTKLSRITALSSDLALALAAPTGQVRIEAPIPGRSLLGIEIPNRGLEFVTLKHMLSSDILKNAKSKLAVTLGLDVSGSPVIIDIGRMPHVLIAGATGSGKSVLINSWISCLLFRTTPSELRLILVDPKRVELTGYNGIPHLLTPVIVEQEKILSALNWTIKEMEDRYKRFAEVGVRNIDGYNELSGFQSMPYILIFIDELADLMAYAHVEVEDSVCRLAQMARATGIHLVVATQRPSVDVLTGLIKANIPCRIAFNVSSMVDSRVIIDMPGAEKLLGRGDMLYVPPDQAKPTRIQGTFVSEKEIQRVVEYFRSKQEAVEYTEEVLTQPVSVGRKRGVYGMWSEGSHDSLFEDALRLICQYDKASASLLQRRLSIGYARAARILDQLEEAGIIGPAEGSKPRDVLVKSAEAYLAQKAQEEQV